MFLILALVYLLLLVIIPSVLVKIAVSILPRGRLSWTQCFNYGGVFAALILAMRILISLSFDKSLATRGGLVLAGLLHLSFGSWYFRHRLVDTQGAILGWTGAFKLMSVTTALIVAVGGVALLFGIVVTN